jgi:hypothetical protein
MDAEDWFWVAVGIAILIFIMAYGGYHPGDIPEDPRR